MIDYVERERVLVTTSLGGQREEIRAALRTALCWLDLEEEIREERQREAPR